MLLCSSVVAAEISIVGVTEKKALLVIDGGKPIWLAVGESSGGVKLIDIDGDAAIIESDNKRETVRMGQNARLAGDTASGAESATLTADNVGQFFTDGAINGIAVRFLIDTGASFVTMNASDAKRLGIDYLSGQRTMMATANGNAVAYIVTLDEVRVGDITINNVHGIVHSGDELPIMLLGMSFLNRMEMQRNGETMVLTKRF